MEKENPQPKTQPSGNMPPPRPPKCTAIGLGSDDEDPEPNRRRRVRREIVQINLPATLLGKPPIQLPLLPGAPAAKAQPSRHNFKDRSATWPIAMLLILSIWAFIGAVVNMLLNWVYSDINSGHSRNLEVALILLLLWAIPAQFIRYQDIRFARK